MPLTSKGKKIMSAMKEHYDSPEQAERVFYASENKGTIKGVHVKGARSMHRKAKGMK